MLRSYWDAGRSLLPGRDADMAGAQCAELWSSVVGVLERSQDPNGSPRLESWSVNVSAIRRDRKRSEVDKKGRLYVP